MRDEAIRSARFADGGVVLARDRSAVGAFAARRIGSAGRAEAERFDEPDERGSRLLLDRDARVGSHAPVAVRDREPGYLDDLARFVGAVRGFAGFAQELELVRLEGERRDDLPPEDLGSSGQMARCCGAVGVQHAIAS
jgi:hypothetical protein